MSARLYALEKLPRRVLFAAPFNLVPLTPQSLEEDGELRFSAANGNAIIVSAVAPAPTENLRVTLTATGGVVSLGSLAGIDLISEDGLGDTRVTFEGTPHALNRALDGLQFVPARDYAGPAWLRIETSVAGSSSAVRADDTIALDITPIDDPPVIATPPGAIHIAEDTPLVLGGVNAIRISDSDSADGDVRVSVSATYGTVTLANQPGVIAATDADTGADAGAGTETGTGAGTGVGTGAISVSGRLADVNAALEGLTFLPAAHFNGEAALRVEVNDPADAGAGQGLSAAAEVSIIVDPVKDAPVLAVSEAPLPYTEGDGAVPIDPVLGLADLDGNSTIRWATIRIVGYIAGQELLGFTGAEGISGHFNARFGTLTLHGKQSVARYESALRSVTYQNLSSSPAGSTRISFTVSDGISTFAQERIVTLRDIQAPAAPPIIQPPIGGPAPIIIPGPDALPGDPLEVELVDPIEPPPLETDPVTPPVTEPPTTPPPSTDPPAPGTENPTAPERPAPAPAPTPAPTPTPAPAPGYGAGGGSGTGNESPAPGAPMLEVPTLPGDPSPWQMTDAPENRGLEIEDVARLCIGSESPVSIPVLEPLQPPPIGEAIPEVAFVASEGELWTDLDTLREEVEAPEKSLRLLAGVATMGSLSVSMIYILWTVRAGYLLASLLSSVPAWGFIDPLPILDHFGERRPRRRDNGDPGDDGDETGFGGGEESLHSMVAQEDDLEGATS